jgi:hypothetical protein
VDSERICQVVRLYLRLQRYRVSRIDIENGEIPKGFVEATNFHFAYVDSGVVDTVGTRPL